MNSLFKIGWKLTLCFILFTSKIVSAQFNSFVIDDHAADLHLIKGIELDLFNTDINLYLPFSPNSLFTSNAEGDYVMNLTQLALKGKKRNSLAMEMGLTVFSYSGMKNRNPYRISYREDIFFNTSISKDILNLVGVGNRAGVMVETKLPISELHLSSISYSRPLRSIGKVDVGLTGKLYMGKSTLNLNADVGINTAADLKTIAIGAQGDGYASMPFLLAQVTGAEAGGLYSSLSYFLEVKNPGIGVGLSVNYRLTKQWVLKAGLSDVGLILWTANPTVFSINDAYEWKGMDISGSLDFAQLSGLNNHDEVVRFRDGFLNNLIEPKDKAFITLAPVKAYAALQYDSNDKFSYASSAEVRLVGRFFHVKTSSKAYIKLFNNTTVYGGVSTLNVSHFALPFGLQFKNQKWQFNLYTNNLMGVITPQFTKTYGGGFSATYIIDSGSPVKLKVDNKRPFYQPLKRRQKSGRLF